MWRILEAISMTVFIFNVLSIETKVYKLNEC
jgi:hypothetical protein